MPAEFIFLISRTGRVRLQKFYGPYSLLSRREQGRIVRDVTSVMTARSRKAANVFAYGGGKCVYRRYASLYFVVGVSDRENVLIELEKIHLLVCTLDKYFGNVCELE